MHSTRNKYALAGALAVLLALLGATAAGAAAASGIGPARRFAPRQLVVKFEGEKRGRTVGLPRGAGVLATARALRARPAVEYARAELRRDRLGRRTRTVRPRRLRARWKRPRGRRRPPGGWAQKQWDLLHYTGTATAKLPTSPGGIDVVGAWANLIADGRPGGQGIRVAVLDSGIAYRDYGTGSTCAAPTSRRNSSSPAKTSSTTTACRSTRTATAPTSPGRSPSRRTTGSASPGSPTTRS